MITAPRASKMLPRPNNIAAVDMSFQGMALLLLPMLDGR